MFGDVGRNGQSNPAWFKMFHRVLNATRLLGELFDVQNVRCSCRIIVFLLKCNFVHSFMWIHKFQEMFKNGHRTGI